MKLGFVSAILPDQSLEQVLATAQRIGYQCVELMCWPVGRAERRYAGVTHIEAGAMTDEGVAAVHEMLARYQIEISSLGYYPNPLSPDVDEAARAVEHIRSVITASAKLGVGRMTTFIGRDWTQSVDANWPRFLETWQPIVAHAEGCGVKIGIENCPMFFTDDEWPGGKNLATSPAIWRKMFEAIPSDHFGLNYDPSHLVWQQIDYIAPLREFAERIFHVHAKDVRVDRHRLDDVGILATPLEYHCPKLPGLGEVDWGRFFSVLGDIGYTGPVCVEVEDRAYEGLLESRHAALEQSRTFLSNFMHRTAS
jgi:sugar phosphate isomerase/epimerase